MTRARQDLAGLLRTDCCDAQVWVETNTLGQAVASCSDCEHDIELTPEAAAWARVGIVCTEAVHRPKSLQLDAIRQVMGLPPC